MAHDAHGRREPAARNFIELRAPVVRFRHHQRDDPPALPSVNYQAIRPGVDLRVPVGKLSLLAQAGFRGVLSAGDVALRFRGTTTTGFDIGAGAAFVLATGWEVRAAAEYEGYFYSFNSQSSDLYRAQSAVDQLYGGRIAIAAVF